MRKQQQVQVDGHDLTLSNSDKVYFPECGFTKGEVVAFYAKIAEWILPHLRDRPLTLKRYPDGVTGEPFYEKNAPKHTPSWVQTFPVPRSEGGPPINYVLCNDLATLLWATNLGDVEKHVLLAQVPDVNHPTSVVFDLDPGEPAGILDCCDVALKLKQMFDALKLESFVKVSGSKGLHLNVPLNSATPYEATQPFAKAVADLLAQQMKDRVVADMAKDLRKGKVLIDWSQNSDFKTTVCVYAMRAKREQPFISMPITWEEVHKAAKKGDEKRLFFTPEQAVRRLKRLGDLHAPVLTLRQKLPQGFMKALASGPPPKLSRWPRNHSAEAKDKSLREYEAKRDHSRTPEPAASVRKSKETGPLSFVIQKHDASHLHYDFRLEMQGVLRSWAVPKGPPRALKETRLAMHVEDHPMEYASFEGTIPTGNYGAGTVMVWDQGTYEEMSGNPVAAYHQGKLHLIMRGKKLKGEWVLLRDRRDDDERRWLLIKAGKELKLPAKADDTSVITGRSMGRIASDNDAQWHSNRTQADTSPKPPAPRRRTAKPAFVEPMQCKPVHELPTDEGWTFELKFDGYRALAIKAGSKVAVYSRNHKRLDHRFPALPDAFAQIEGDWVIDGEVVTLGKNGQPSFQILQHTSGPQREVLFYAFDLIHHHGEDLKQLPLEERRLLLAEVMAGSSDPIRLAPVLEAPPEEVLKAITKMGMEGIVGKRAGSLYEPGERSGAWIKMKTNRQQEFVIGGYTVGLHGFDALVVGVYQEGELMYAARVKSGFVPRVRADILKLLKKRLRKSCPFANLPEKKGSQWGESLTAEKMEECRWVKPDLVCQVAFVEWTGAGHLRHSSFVAMREDKGALEVERES